MADGSLPVDFGSVCSGIEAASVAWHPLGWRAAWLAEIEPFPCAVLAHHYPDTPNLGDMTALPERIRAGEIPAPTVFTGGTPCQAFSVAGKRESLADARGNLSLTFCEIANAIDDVRAADGNEPCVVLWENVPGVLSTSDNAFGCFLGALAGADDALVAPGGRWSDAGVVLGPRRAVAWRILDAQFFGLAQRRRRVFVVASARNGFDPAQVLLEFDGVRRDSAPRRETREDAAGSAAPGAGTGFGGGRTSGPVEVAACLVAKGQKCDFEAETFIAHTLRGEGFDASEDGTGRGTPLVPVSVALRGREGGAAAELGDDVAFTLRASEGGGDKPHVMVPVREVAATLGGRMRGQDDACADNLLPVAFSCKDHGADASADVAPTLRAMGSTDGRPNGGGQVAVAMPFRETADCLTSAYGTKWNGNASADNGSLFVGHPVAFHCDAQADQLPGPETDTSASASLTCSQRAAVAIAPTITATNDPSRSPQSAEVTAQVAAVHGVSMQVRRLTPRECERLQGFPDDYTRIPSWNGWRQVGADETPEQLAAEGLEVRQNKKTGRWRVKDVDGPRYKALGNSWAVPCVAWIGGRIDSQLRAAQSLEAAA